MIKAILLILLLLIIGTYYVSYDPVLDKPEVFIQKKVEVKSNSTFDQYKAINNDYFGYLSFENELINQPILMGYDNEFYLDHDIRKEPYSSGSVFVDYRYNNNLQNLVVYGHYVYRDNSLIFSPLHKLLDDNYQEYDEFLIQYQYHTDYYQVVYALLFDINADIKYNYTLDFHKDLETFNDFNSFYSSKSQIKNTSLSYDDKLVILQTCVRDQDDLRLIVIAKKID